MALKYIEDITIGGKNVRGIKLAETDNAIVYIPVMALQNIDYKRLSEIFDKPDSSTRLEKLRDSKLDNGRYAISVYDSIIRYYYIDQEQGSLSPEEKVSAEKSPSYNEEEVEEPTETNTSTKKRGPGRPKKEESE